MSEIIEEIMAPYIPIFLIGINTKFNISLIIPPSANAITGTFTFPNPCNAPFIVCVRTIKIIVNADNCSISAPFAALGNNICNISFENIIIYIVNGMPISIVTNIENSILLSTT